MLLDAAAKSNARAPNGQQYDLPRIAPGRADNVQYQGGSNKYHNVIMFKVQVETPPAQCIFYIHHLHSHTQHLHHSLEKWV